ncbi:MAG: hypothetical protein ABI853_05000 [Sphingomicrobium sp.]
MDPEIEALLDFEPVPRQRVVAGAWTPELQREFIARMAVTGSCGRASEEMGKTDTGVRKLYRSPEGASFRAAWDGAVELAKRRKAEGAVTEEAVVPGSRPPTLDHRRKHDPSPQPSPQPLSREGGEGPSDLQDDRKWQLIEQIGARFLKKVAAEREARTRGEIVAADFYLRQISFIEVLLDLSASKFGWDAQEMLRGLRRGGRGPVEIVSTPLADWLDQARRAMWREDNAPERPEHPDPRFTRDHHSGPWGNRASEGYSTALPTYATGAASPPAEGYGAEQWAELTSEKQRAARERQLAADAEEQRKWEAQAIAEQNGGAAK